MTTRTCALWVALCAGGLTACDGGGGRLSNDPPTEVTRVVVGGFESPTDAVASPDGITFYFAAFVAGEDPVAAIFSVPAAGGDATMIASGPPLEHPTGLVLSPDGGTLYIADMGSIDSADATAERGGLFALSVPHGGTPARLAADGLSVPSGLALSLDGDTLYATGTTDRREPALFTLPPAGGTALVRYRGAPLASPSGVHVDEAGVAWVMDYVGGSGESGALFAIAPDGAISTVLEGLRLGAPAGVTLTAGGGTAVIPTRDANGAGQLTSVRIDNGQRQELAAPILADPTGIRAAREANVMVVVDSEGDAIFRAE